MLKTLSGNSDQGLQAMEALNEEWQLLFQDDIKDKFYEKNVYSEYLLDRAWFAHDRGDPETAEWFLEEGMTRIAEALQELPNNRQAGNLLMLAVFRFWEMKHEFPAQRFMVLVPDFWRNSGRTRACVDASMAARKAMMFGDTDRAIELTDYLMDKGYSEIGFIRVCKAYSLCKGR